MNDRERLDWLNEHMGDWPLFLLHNWGDNGVMIECCNDGYKTSEDQFKAPTIRKVIDLAMLAEEAEEQA